MSPRLNPKISGGWLIIVALAAALALLVGSFYWVVNHRENLIDSYANLAQIADERGELGALNQLLDRTAAQREALEKYYINEQAVSELLGNLEEWGRELEVNLEVEQAEIVGSDVPRLALQLTATGSATRVSRFLNLLDNLPYLAIVNTADLRQQSSSTWSANITLEVLSFETN